MQRIKLGQLGLEEIMFSTELFQTNFAGREPKKLRNHKNSLFAPNQKFQIWSKNFATGSFWHLIVFIPGARSSSQSLLVIVTLKNVKVTQSMAINLLLVTKSRNKIKALDFKSNCSSFVRVSRKKEWNETRMKSETGFFVIRPKQSQRGEDY